MRAEDARVPAWLPGRVRSGLRSARHGADGGGKGRHQADAGAP